MSAKKACNKFQKLSGQITEEKIAKIIGKTLRYNFPNSKSGIKFISQKTNIDVRSIWNWYNGLYAPNLLNFIILSQKFPFLIQVFLELCNKSKIWDTYQGKINPSGLIKNSFKNEKNDNFYTVIFDGIRPEHLKLLNQRQLWFLENIVSGYDVRKADITEFWSVSGRTAERDIAVLVELNIIKFVGSKKYGRYFYIDLKNWFNT